MFRMNRDVCFSKDKSPYKTSVSGLLTSSGTKAETAGMVCADLNATGGWVAGGFYRLPTAQLSLIGQRISNTLEADFCVEALNEAIHKFGSPEIMNTDPGSQFTSFARTHRLRQSRVRTSMDGKGRFLDDIFVERLWQSLKYECVYLHAWETGSEAKAGIRKWMAFYNHKRPHAAHGGQPPAVVYWHRNETPDPDQQLQKVA